jgi:hypothetical protein
LVLEPEQRVNDQPARRLSRSVPCPHLNFAFMTCLVAVNAAETAALQLISS